MIFWSLVPEKLSVYTTYIETFNKNIHNHVYIIPESGIHSLSLLVFKDLLGSVLRSYFYNWVL
jgi:hypothetical protein